MRYDDVYDFDPKPLINFNSKDTTRRTFSGEVQTRYADANLPGVKYDVTSPDVEVIQQSGDERAQWSGSGKGIEIPLTSPNSLLGTIFNLNPSPNEDETFE